jgi:hypothetical protein
MDGTGCPKSDGDAELKMSAFWDIIIIIIIRGATALTKGYSAV